MISFIAVLAVIHIITLLTYVFIRPVELPFLYLLLILHLQLLIILAVSFLLNPFKSYKENNTVNLSELGKHLHSIGTVGIIIAFLATFDILLIGFYNLDGTATADFNQKLLLFTLTVSLLIWSLLPFQLKQNEEMLFYHTLYQRILLIKREHPDFIANDLFITEQRLDLNFPADITQKSKETMSSELFVEEKKEEPTISPSHMPTTKKTIHDLKLEQFGNILKEYFPELWPLYEKQTIALNLHTTYSNIQKLFTQHTK